MVSLNVPVMVEAVREYDSGVTVRPGVHVRLQVLPDLVVAVQLSVCDMVETVSDMLADCVCVTDTETGGDTVTDVLADERLCERVVAVLLSVIDREVAVSEPVTDFEDSERVTRDVTLRVDEGVVVTVLLQEDLLDVSLPVFDLLDRVTLIEDVPEDGVTVLLVCDAEALDTVTLLVAVDADSVALTDPEVAVPLELRVRDVCVAVNG